MPYLIVLIHLYVGGIMKSEGFLHRNKEGSKDDSVSPHVCEEQSRGPEAVSGRRCNFWIQIESVH